MTLGKTRFDRSTARSIQMVGNTLEVDDPHSVTNRERGEQIVEEQKRRGRSAFQRTLCLV